MELKSRQLLLDFMTLRGIPSAYALARAAGLSYAIAGHLVAGRRKTCSPETAAKIERALSIDENVLFVPQVLQVANNTPSRKRAAA